MLFYYITRTDMAMMRNVMKWALLVLLAWSPLAAATLLVSIKPLQLLATAVTGDPAEVELLLDPLQSHHEYQLRPSDRQRLQSADVIFWIGPELETFLARPLASVSDSARVVALGTGSDTGHHHAGADDHRHAHGDAHSWLDPMQAVRMARGMAAVLAEREPMRRAELDARVERLAEALARVDKEISAALAALPARRPYLVLHDAYGHFERHHGLQRAATYALTPERAPGPRHLLALQRQLEQGAIRCVFHEPQFAPKALAPLLERPGLRSVELDLMAAATPATESGFVDFYRGFGLAFVDCLRP
jgi:zinc transport system substrate-binding protein